MITFIFISEGQGFGCNLAEHLCFSVSQAECPLGLQSPPGSPGVGLAALKLTHDSWGYLQACRAADWMSYLLATQASLHNRAPTMTSDFPQGEQGREQERERTTRARFSLWLALRNNTLSLLLCSLCKEGVTRCSPASREENYMREWTAGATTVFQGHTVWSLAFEVFSICIHVKHTYLQTNNFRSSAWIMQSMSSRRVHGKKQSGLRQPWKLDVRD